MKLWGNGLKIYLRNIKMTKLHAIPVVKRFSFVSTAFDISQIIKRKATKEPLYILLFWVFKEKMLLRFTWIGNYRSSNDGVQQTCGEKCFRFDFAEWKTIPLFPLILPLFYSRIDRAFVKIENKEEMRLAGVHEWEMLKHEWRTLSTDWGALNVEWGAPKL